MYLAKSVFSGAGLIGRGWNLGARPVFRWLSLLSVDELDVSPTGGSKEGRKVFAAGFIISLSSRCSNKEGIFLELSTGNEYYVPESNNQGLHHVLSIVGTVMFLLSLFRAAEEVGEDCH